MSLKHLHGVNSKILRAEEHYEALHADIAEYLKVCGQSVQPYVSEKTNTIRIRFSVARPVPLRISVIFGDCVFNTRCALDHLWKRLGSVGNFPIFADIDGPNNWLAKRDQILADLPVNAHAIIDALQPCHRGKDAPLHPLAILNKLSNLDKHETIHLLAAQSENTKIIVTNQASGEIHTPAPPTPFYEEADIMITDMPPGAVKPGMDVKVKGSLHVAFKEAGPWGRKPIHEVIHRSLDFVKNDVIVPLIEFTK